MPNGDEAQESLQGLRILLVEDDPLIRLDLESSLSDLGAIVISASDVAAALEIVAAATLDFAVLDFELGVETSEPIVSAALEHKVPFLYLSGYSDNDQRFARWPDAIILVKPISASAIARHIRRALSERR
ncbi:MAG TPA: response regulator [Dongiaceae bacterium]|jgi:DNA-binding response OmpR family regulator